MNDPILDAPIEEHLRAAMPAGEADRMWRSFKLREQAAPARRAARRRRAAVWGAGAVVLAAAAAFGLVVLVPHGEAGPVALAEGHALPATLGSQADPSVYDLDDGSRIVLAPRTDAQVVANDEVAVRARLDRGSATFDVRPGGPRRWIIDAGDARVEVLGTRFSVTRRGAAVEVRVERGLVEVHHPSLDRPAQLTAGQSVTVGEVDPPDGSGEREPAAIVEEPTEAEGSPEPVAAPDAWRTRVERGDFVGAYRLLGTLGLRERARSAGPEDLMTLADIARRAGHPSEAMPIYARVVERSPGDVRAPVAAFSRGRLQLAGAPAMAAESFAFVRAHPAGAALFEEATALEAGARSRAGQGAGARLVAAEYLARFPEGRHAESMLRLTEAR